MERRRGARVLIFMRMFVFPSAMLLAACAPQPVARPAPIRPGNLAGMLLQAHNAERTAVNVGPVIWDPALAQAASDYAHQLSRIGTLRHSSRNARHGQGENLWMGTRGAFGPQEMAASWASEMRWFRRGVFPAVSTTGRWSDVGHYSQMIWPTTTRLGCAIASSASADFLVCRYSPAGNIDGRRVP